MLEARGAEKLHELLESVSDFLSAVRVLGSLREWFGFETAVIEENWRPGQ